VQLLKNTAEEAMELTLQIIIAVMNNLYTKRLRQQMRFMIHHIYTLITRQ